MDTQGFKWEEIAPYNEKDSCIIEFQAFRGNDNKFLVKELVILDVQLGTANYFLFKPPYPFHNLKEKAKRNNKWLSKYFHHISWYEGFTDYRELKNVLQFYCNKYKYVFTSGLEKSELLSSYAPSEVTVYNVCRQKDENVPGICIGVGCNIHKYSNCAMSNALGLRATLIKESKALYGDGGGDKVVGVLGHK